MKANLTSREPPESLSSRENENLYEQIQKAGKRSCFRSTRWPAICHGDVHMGTALNKVLKDLIVERACVMAGFRTPDIPGWDCHRIAHVESRWSKNPRALSPLEVRRTVRGVCTQIHRYSESANLTAWSVRRWEHPYLTLDPAYEAVVAAYSPKWWTRTWFFRAGSLSFGAPAPKPR